MQRLQDITWLYRQSQESLNIKISSEESGTVAKGTASEDRELQVPQTCLFGIRVIFSSLFLRNSRRKKSSENLSRSYDYIHKRNLHLWGYLPLCARNRRVTKSLATCLCRRPGLKSAQQPYLFLSVLFLVTLLDCPSPTPHHCLNIFLYL